MFFWKLNILWKNIKICKTEFNISKKLDMIRSNGKKIKQNIVQIKFWKYYKRTSVNLFFFLLSVLQNKYVKKLVENNPFIDMIKAKDKIVPPLQIQLQIEEWLDI